MALLLFFGALAEIEFKSRSGDTDFLACWWEQNEIPLFLVLGDRVLSEVGERCTGLYNQLVLLALHSVMDVLWRFLPFEEIRCASST